MARDPFYEINPEIWSVRILQLEVIFFRALSLTSEIVQPLAKFCQ